MADKGVRHEAFELLADLRRSERVAKQEAIGITMRTSDQKEEV